MTGITVRGARQHNLKAVDLDLPRDALVVFTGVSGSGKTSLAFDTLHAEGRRRYLEALAADVGPGVRGLDAPDVDAIVGLPPTIALEQRATTPSSRSTVGSLAEVWPVLQVLYARAGTQHCPSCRVAIRPSTHDEIVAVLARNPAGTRLTLEAPVRRAGEADTVALLDEIARAGFSRVRLDGRMLRVEEVIPAAAQQAREVRVVVDRLRLGDEKRERLHDAVRTTARAGQGVLIAVLGDEEQVFTDRPYCLACDRPLPELRPRLFSFFAPSGACPVCQGSGTEGDRACSACGGDRLREEARAVTFAGRSLPEHGRLPVERLLEEMEGWPRTAVSDVAMGELRRRVEVLVEVGLGHLPLMRPAPAVSGGELQRLRLARQVGARLSGVLYVLDEPTAGLHEGEVARIVSLLERLREQGNTVLVVEHQRPVVEAADRVVDFGPGPGARGGRVVYEGEVAGLLGSETTTGRWLSGRERLGRGEGATPSGFVVAEGLVEANLDGVDVRLPLGAMAAVIGPSGSGKSALLRVIRQHLLARIGSPERPTTGLRALSGAEGVERLVVVDDAPVGRLVRSNPATYTGLWDTVREMLAATREGRVRGMDPSTFSLNVKGGRCEACRGTGVRKVEMGMLPDVWLVCDVCEGARFASDVLEVRWKGMSAAAILDLEVDEAATVLAGHPRVDEAIRALRDVGLGYVQLGQPGHTLSGGEARRLRLARELTAASRRGGAGTVYVLDDPTIGLHPADVEVLRRLLRRLVEEGATVWLATHDAALASTCDWTVTLGPGGGPDGGRVITMGAP